MDYSYQLTVSIVVYNSSISLLRNTLKSLEVAAFALKDSPGVIVIDNNSSANYRRELALLIEEFRLSPNFHISHCFLNENLGYGGAHNIAVSSTRDLHLILNPDVTLEPQALQLGVDAMRSDNEIVLLSPRAIGPNGAPEYLCKRYPSLWVLLLRALAPDLGRRFWGAQMDSYQMTEVCDAGQVAEIPLASGCFMLVRAEPLRQIGGFDDSYFMYFEDFDLSLRIAAYGRLLYFPEMRIVHHGGYAASKGWKHLKMFASSGVRFFRQHGWRWI
ncbi:MAG: glycosyltransferase family 2 protein [Halioglobus sp.]